MQEIVANVEDITFDIEIALEQQLGAHPLPFPGMDSKFNMSIISALFMLLISTAYNSTSRSGVYPIEGGGELQRLYVYWIGISYCNYLNAM